MKPQHKLVIFDIDGTLIRALRPIDNLQRFRYSIKKIFGTDIGEITQERWKQGNFNGKGDRFILWSLIEPFGVSKDAFLDRIGQIGDAFSEYLDSIASGGSSYEVIPDAKQLVEKVIEAEHLSEGVLTGNLGQSARWKLHSAGLPDFAFGVYGHEADAREDLARLLLPKAKEFYGHPISPGNVIILGDTVNDVLCAKAIGAVSVIVTTGWDVPVDELVASKPDYIVDTLLDERVLDLLGLEK